MGFWAFLSSKREQRSNIDLHLSGNLAFSGLSPVEEAARIWLFACLATTAIRIIPHAFWQDDWDRRHAEFRLLLGAMATVALVKWPQFYRLMGRQKNSLCSALAAACTFGMGVTALYGRETPLHPIAWAVSLSFLVCLLAPMVLDPLISSTRRTLWALAVFLGCMGVVLSQSRGVYGLLIWMALASYVAASNRTLLQMSTIRTNTWLALGLLFGGFIWMLWVQPGWLTAVFQRLGEVWVGLWQRKQHCHDQAVGFRNQFRAGAKTGAFAPRIFGCLGQPRADGHHQFVGTGHGHGFGGAHVVGATSACGSRHLGHFVHAPHGRFVQYQHGPQLLWGHVVSEHCTGAGHGGQ